MGNSLIKVIGYVNGQNWELAELGEACRKEGFNQDSVRRALEAVGEGEGEDGPTEIPAFPVFDIKLADGTEVLNIDANVDSGIPSDSAGTDAPTPTPRKPMYEIVDEIDVIVKDTDGIVTGMSSTVDGVVNILTPMSSTVEGMSASIGSKIDDTVDGVVNILTPMSSTVEGMSASIGSKIDDTVNGMGDTIGGKIDSRVNELQEQMNVLHEINILMHDILNRTFSPTSSPSISPSISPSKKPTLSPSGSPSKMPTISPSTDPTSSPTSSPTTVPSVSVQNELVYKYNVSILTVSLLLKKGFTIYYSFRKPLI